MGAICCTKAQEPKAAFQETKIQEPEITIPTFTSGADKDFSKLETKFNFLRELVFSDFIYSLSTFTLENATLPDDFSKKPEKYSKKDDFFNSDFSEDLFQSFIENKILKHQNLYSKAGENETLTLTFKDILLQLHKNLNVKLSQCYKAKGIEVTGNVIKKSHIAALGFLYCGGQNVYKIRFLYDVFNNDGLFVKNNELDDFLLALFLLPSYCMLATRNKIHKTNSEIEQLPKDTMKKILDTCELKDSENLVSVFNQTLFPTEESKYSYNSFKMLFDKSNSTVSWLLSPKGIRNMLEKNNV